LAQHRPSHRPSAPPPSASACAVHRDAIEVGLSRGRNTMAIWQDLVDTCSFTGGYQSVKRFVRKLAGGTLCACHPPRPPPTSARIYRANRITWPSRRAR